MPNKKREAREVVKKLERIAKKEDILIYTRSSKQPSKLDYYLEEKMPDTLQDTLNAAFAKGFKLVFSKGTKLIEKSYKKDVISRRHDVNAYAYGVIPDRKRLKAFTKNANKSSRTNVAVSTVKGVSLGALGIGLPDIPVFITIVLKGIYETALHYGFKYDTEEERYFILSIISASLSYGDDLLRANRALDDYISDPQLPESYDESAEILMVSDVLATELLCMKFLQGVPIVGVVGGVSDAVFVNRILSFAKLKYEKRFLTNLALALPEN